MASTGHERALLEGLQRAVHGVGAPFACGGTLVPEQPVTLWFPDKTQIPVLPPKDTNEQEQVLRPLVNRCQAAAFGVGRKTRYDSTVRDALQMKAGAFSVLHFDPAAAGILEEVRRELAPQAGALTAELYNLNVYARGGHFVSHKDTPRGAGMLGTLVVCLPSQFSSGAFSVKHHGLFQTYDWGQAIKEQAEPARVHWAAFFGDCDHQIERVWSGLRVTLSYLIRYGGDPVPEPRGEPLNTLVRQAVRALLDDRRFLAKGGTLAFPCSHLYLKGRDHEVAATAMAEGLAARSLPYPERKGRIGRPDGPGRPRKCARRPCKLRRDRRLRCGLGGSGFARHRAPPRV